MRDVLTTTELVDLIRRVFKPRPGDRGLAILADLPDEDLPDHGSWIARREMAVDWAQRLSAVRQELGLEKVSLVFYPNVRRPNQDLPERGFLHSSGVVPFDADQLRGEGIPFTQIFKEHQILIAPTELSATAPLKLAAKEFRFRAATMPGFVEEMVPALRLDWEEIDRRCRALKERLDQAEEARLVFAAGCKMLGFIIDLRYRTAHASGGMLTEPGIAGNLPSGESYIVPYEGEREGDPSRTCGTLPLEIDGELLFFRVEANRVVEVQGVGPAAQAERRDLSAEPAYGNLAELGFGVLHSYGVKPIGELLLDEKLGLHLAFGRSDHFGGTVGSKDWKDPNRVVHIDRVFIRETMPKVAVLSVDLLMPDGTLAPLMREGEYV